jgi:hypothetical protein
MCLSCCWKDLDEQDLMEFVWYHGNFLKRKRLTSVRAFHFSKCPLAAYIRCRPFTQLQGAEFLPYWKCVFRCESVLGGYPDFPDIHLEYHPRYQK